MRVMVLSNVNGKMSGVSLMPENEKEQQLLIQLQHSRPWMDANWIKYPVSLTLLSKDWEADADSEPTTKTAANG